MRSRNNSDPNDLMTFLIFKNKFSSPIFCSIIRQTTHVHTRSDTHSRSPYCVSIFHSLRFLCITSKRTSFATFYKVTDETPKIHMR